MEVQEFIIDTGDAIAWIEEHMEEDWDGEEDREDNMRFVIELLKRITVPEIKRIMAE